MKILTVGYLHGAGGAERQIILLSNKLAGLEHNVTLCILAENNSQYSINENVNVVDLSKSEGKGYKRIFNRYTRFRNLIKNYSPDVIVNYNIQSAFFCLTLPKKTRGICIYSERGDPYDNEYSGLLKIVRDFTVNNVDGIVFQSEGARDFFSKDILKKSIVIQNSVKIPPHNYVAIENREARIVSVGRLHPQKNHKLLIDAFGMIAKEFPQYILDIYGDGNLHDELQEQIMHLGLTKRINLNSSCNNIFEKIYKASLFVLTSDYEGMPNALMEAMALGLPCISTDCRPGGARTLIKNNVNGIIVPCNDVESLVNEIRKVLNNKEFANSLSSEALKIQQTNSESAVFGKWNDYLMRLHNSHSK